MERQRARTRSQAITLSDAYTCRTGGPVLRRVRTDIFTRTYFTHCLGCDFCHDQCCSYGVDVDLVALSGIQRHAAALEARTGIPRDEWFEHEIEWDAASPGGGTVRTRVRDGRCIFLNRKSRGCHIHAWCLDNGVDYHELKSVVDCLFPLTYEGELLSPATEVDDGSLACINTGPTLYRGARGELAWYFGDRFVAELDALERSVAATR